MALIICPDCSTEVSDQAISCPKCGRPLKIEDPTIKEVKVDAKAKEGCFLQTLNIGCMIIAIIVGTIVVLVIFGLMSS